MSTVQQEVLPQTFIGGHDGTERPYTLSATATVPHGAIGAEMGWLALECHAYKSDITAVRVNGVDCDTSLAPDGSSETTVLPHDTDTAPGGDVPVTVHVYDTPVWTPGGSTTFEIDFTRHAQPVGDTDRTTVWAKLILTYNMPNNRAGAAPLWVWGANGDGQCGTGNTDDVLAPLSSEDLASPATPFADAVDVSAGGSEDGTRALVRRQADMLERAAGLDSDGTTFARSGDPTLWTAPTVPSRSPDHATRGVWGFSKVAFGRSHGIIADGNGNPNLYGIGTDASAQGTGGVGDDQPIFTKLPLDDPTTPWLYPARAPQAWAGDDVSEVVGQDGDSMWLHSLPARVYGSGDASRLNGAGGGNRFDAVYGESDVFSHQLPNIHGESSSATCTVLLTQHNASPFEPRLTSWGSNDKGQCGVGAVSVSETAAAVLDFLSLGGGGHKDVQYVSVGWKGVTVLVRDSSKFQQPDEYEIWSWGYPHPQGDASGQGFINGVSGATGDYCHTPIQVALPDLGYPEPPPDPDNYDLGESDPDFIADYAAWDAGDKLLYATPQFVLHGRGHRLLVAQRPLVANPDESPQYYCWDIWTQGWNDHGQRGDGSTGGHDASWAHVLSIRPPLGPFGFYGPMRVTLAWDTNYIIALECEIPSMIGQVAVLVG